MLNEKLYDKLENFWPWAIMKAIRPKKAKKQVWLKMLRIVQFGEKSNKKFLPVIILKADYSEDLWKNGLFFGKIHFST